MIVSVSASNDSEGAAAACRVQFVQVVQSFKHFESDSAIEIDIVCSSRGEPEGAQAQKRSVSILFLVLGQSPIFF
jgi:hypothetical protein